MLKLFVISDLHLSFGVDKPMNVFGDKWNNYEEKIKDDWLSKVKDDDYVILAGDISWAMYLEEATKDFEFINNLPGKKIILKGNHDYWWETVTKLNTFLKENKFNSIMFLHNNFIDVGDYLICGTRYWAETEGYDNEKVFNREITRAKLSLKLAADYIKLNEEKNIKDSKLTQNLLKSNKKIIMCTHFPPDDKIIEAVKEYDIKYWIYAHIHSNYEEHLVHIPGIPSSLTSCDYLEFNLLEVKV